MMSLVTCTYGMYMCVFMYVVCMLAGYNKYNLSCTYDDKTLIMILNKLIKVVELTGFVYFKNIVSYFFFVMCTVHCQLTQDDHIFLLIKLIVI